MAESHDHDHDFEGTDAGASLVYPMQAGNIRKNGHICIKGRPCKVVDVSTSKTGKHGHAKCHFVAIDIFTGKKMEDLCPSSHNAEVPHVNRADFSLLSIDDEGFLSLMDEGGSQREDLKLPSGTEELDKLAEQIQNDFNDGKELVLTVLKSMNVEMIISSKEVKA